MIINMAGGGGGAALNFKVVPGLTQPGTASENTIWVKTERIGAWYFSATQPEGLQEWDVWFQTGTESDVEFNALRKNAVQVYPLSAKQMASGVLVDLEAKSYRSGAWVDWWDGYYYRDGNEYDFITGGWVIKENKGTTYTALGNLTKQADGLVINLPGARCGACLRTEEMVDLTDIQKINISWVVDSGSFGGGHLYATNNISLGEWDWNNKAADSPDIKGSLSTEVDVSALQGKFYVCFAIDDMSSGTAKIRVTEVGST